MIRANRFARIALRIARATKFGEPVSRQPTGEYIYIYMYIYILKMYARDPTWWVPF